MGRSAVERRVEVRAMKHVDVPTVVRAHLDAFPHGFYSRLGPEFMTAYVRAHLRSPAACSLAAVDRRTGEVVGYLLGTLDDAAHRAHKARQSSGLLAREGFRALRRRPELWGEFLRVRALWYAKRLARARMASPRANSVCAAAGRSAELQYICVKQQLRLRGVGSDLHDRFVLEARSAGVATVRLVTEEDNHVARGLYEHRGWVSDGTVQSRDGRRLLRMLLLLVDDAA